VSCVSWLKQRFDEPDYHLFYEHTSRQAADIYTKLFDNADKWSLALSNLNVVAPSDFDIVNMNYYANQWQRDTPNTTLAEPSDDDSPTAPAIPPTVPVTGGPPHHTSAAPPLSSTASDLRSGCPWYADAGTPVIGAPRPTDSGATRATVARLPGSVRQDDPADPPNRVIIEVCCSANSKMGQHTSFSAGCLVIRITIDDDFTSQPGIQKVLVALQQYAALPILVWVSIPCTGGTQWTYYNWAKGGPKTRALISGHVETFRKLFDSFTLCLQSTR
jgi:hypothetical protein